MRSAPRGLPPCSSTMSGCLARILSSASQDAGVIVALDAAGEGNARTGRSENFSVRAAAGGEKFPAVDHRGGERAVIDHGSGAGRQAEPMVTS